MKKYTLYIICLLLAVAATSCKKEKEEDSFLKGQMTEFHGQKAYVDGENYSCFRVNETIRVNNRSCTVSAVSSNDRICTITGAEEANGYYAFYPANLISATDLSNGFREATVTLPRVQQYAEENGHQVIDNPMAGYLEGSSGIIQFNNLCALLKVTVKSNWILDSIQVKLNGAELWGTGTVDGANWKLDMNNGTHDTKYETVSLVFPNDGMNLSSSLPNGKTFYIVVPQTTIFTDANKNDVIVQIYGRYKTATVSKSYSKELTADQPVAYNTINTLPTITRMEVGVGVFTVNAQGKKVAFARTNIIKSGNTFSFLADPWSNGENSNNYYYSYNNLSSYTTNWEWTVNGYPDHTWRIPTTSEWVFLVTSTARNASRRCWFCKVNGKNGLIIYPDGCNLTSPSSHTSNISTTEWANIYESVGCIFLPAHHRYNAGSADNAEKCSSGGEDAKLCIYAMANNICFRSNESGAEPKGTQTSNGISGGATIPTASGVTVRLVHDLN